MKTMRLLLAAFATTAFVSSLTGCTTIVRGGPATKQEGVHYFLPMTIISATPNADGTLTVEPTSIPDPKHEYVVSASSVLGKYTFEAKVAKGLLTDLNMDSDSTEIAKTAVEAAGAIEKAQVAAERKAVAAREEAVAAQETAIKTATKLVQDKKRALEKLRDKRALLLKQGAAEDSDAIKAVDLEIVVAQRDVAYAEEDLAALIADRKRTGNRDVARAGAGNLDSGGSLTVASEAWGSVIYRVEQFMAADELPSVKLVRAEWGAAGGTLQSQVKFRTATIAKTDATETTKIDFEIPPPAAASEPNGDFRTVLVKVNSSLVAVGEGEVLQGPQEKKKADAAVALKMQGGSQQIEARIPTTVPAGTYFLRFKYQVAGSDKMKRLETALEFSVK